MGTSGSMETMNIKACSPAVEEAHLKSPLCCLGGRQHLKTEQRQAT